MRKFDSILQMPNMYGVIVGLDGMSKLDNYINQYKVKTIKTSML